MNRTRQSFLNFLGSFVKIIFVPLTLHSTNLFTHPPPTNPLLLGFIWTLIIINLIGIILSDLLILRYGDGGLYFSLSSTRLVDIGFYAQNRHPSLWFFSGYILGLLWLFSGFNMISLSIWFSITTIFVLYAILYQERQLLKSLGTRYATYREAVPFLTWKFGIAPKLKVRILPQLIWIASRVFLSRWYKIKIKGMENIPHDRPFIVVANHETYIDPFLFSTYIPFEIQFVTTADVFTTPLMRFLLKGIGTFPMERHKQDLKSIRTMIRLVGSGQIVGIFPEGGRSIDGSPLPILKETLKLIKHCKVPILPVHLDGAYEIWPRWASNRRRGQVTATFKPVIPVEYQHNLKELETHIQDSIFSKDKSFSNVNSSRIAQGLDNFLWACPNCSSHNSIKVRSPNIIGCDHCQTSWSVSSNYSLKETGSNKSYTLISWISQIENSILNHAGKDHPDFDLKPGERVYLYSPITRYVVDAGSELKGNLGVSLTGDRVILSEHQKTLESWNIATVTIFTMDYFNAISIGVGGIRHSFFLPSEEITLKWQMFFDKVSSEIRKLDSQEVTTA